MATDDGVLTDDDFTQLTITVCLACADGDCQTCYGDRCECRCGGDEVGTTPAPVDAPTCPDCGARHDVDKCAAEGGMCDCCAAIEQEEIAGRMGYAGTPRLPEGR